MATHRDGLGGLSERHLDWDAGCDISSEAERYFHVSASSAAEVTVGLLRDRAERSVTYVALGPMTTLSHTLRYDHGAVFRSRIGCVVCMGGQYILYQYLYLFNRYGIIGALDVPGNTSAAAECEAMPWYKLLEES